MSPSSNSESPLAVWACGSAASGKSSIAGSALSHLGFESVDRDSIYQELLKKYNLDCTSPEINPKEKERLHAEHITRQTAEAILAEPDSKGAIDPKVFIVRLSKGLHENNLSLKFVLEMEKTIRQKLGMNPVEGEAFLTSICPEINRRQDPEDDLAERQVITPFHVLTVAREIARRKICETKKKRGNILVIERGVIISEVLEIKRHLESEGYRTFLLWFELNSIELAVERNLGHAISGGRRDIQKIIGRSFQMTLLARELLIAQFNPHTAKIDNTPSGDQHIERHISQTTTLIQNWMNSKK